MCIIIFVGTLASVQMLESAVIYGFALDGRLQHQRQTATFPQLFLAWEATM